MHTHMPHMWACMGIVYERMPEPFQQHFERRVKTWLQACAHGSRAPSTHQRLVDVDAPQQREQNEVTPAGTASYHSPRRLQSTAVSSEKPAGGLAGR